MTKPKPKQRATVTVQSARRGVRRVIVGTHVFVVGEPVDDVPDRVREQLEQRDDLTVHVDSSDPDPQEKAAPQ